MNGPEQKLSELAQKLLTCSMEHPSPRPTASRLIAELSNRPPGSYESRTLWLALISAVLRTQELAVILTDMLEPDELRDLLGRLATDTRFVRALQSLRLCGVPEHFAKDMCACALPGPGTNPEPLARFQRADRCAAMQSTTARENDVCMCPCHQRQKETP